MSFVSVSLIWGTGGRVIKVGKVEWDGEAGLGVRSSLCRCSWGRRVVSWNHSLEVRIENGAGDGFAVILASVLCNLKEYGLRWHASLAALETREEVWRPTVLLEIELGLVNCLWLARSHTSLFIRRVWTASGLVCMELASSRRNGNSNVCLCLWRGWLLKSLKLLITGQLLHLPMRLSSQETMCCVV